MGKELNNQDTLGRNMPPRKDAEKVLCQLKQRTGDATCQSVMACEKRVHQSEEDEEVAGEDLLGGGKYGNRLGGE